MSTNLFPWNNKKDQGLKQRRLLCDLFDSLNPQVLISELKAILQDIKWFKKTPDHAYLQIQEIDAQTYISADEALNQIATALEWDERKQEKNRENVKELCFQCDSTTVVLEELLTLMLENGRFGEATTLLKMPLRAEPPSFTSLDIWVNKNPLTISWVQLRAYYDDYFKFMNMELHVDDEFWTLQKKAFKKLDKEARASSRVGREEQTDNLPVPFLDFYNVFSSSIYPSDSCFWETTIGQLWQIQAAAEINTPTTITWESVYDAVCQMKPRFLTLYEALERRTQQHMIKKNNNNNELTIDNIEAGASNSDVTSNITSVADIGAAVISGVETIKQSLSENGTTTITTTVPSTTISTSLLTKLKANFNALIKQSSHGTSSTTITDSNAVPSTSVVSQIVNKVPVPANLDLSALRKTYPSNKRVNRYVASSS